MANQREAEGLLASWREVERALAAVPEYSLEAEAYRAEAARLRDAYQRLVKFTLYPTSRQGPVRPASYVGRLDLAG